MHRPSVLLDVSTLAFEKKPLFQRKFSCMQFKLFCRLRQFWLLRILFCRQNHWCHTFMLNAHPVNIKTVLKMLTKQCHREKKLGQRLKYDIAFYAIYHNSHIQMTNAVGNIWENEIFFISIQNIRRKKRTGTQLQSN